MRGDADELRLAMAEQAKLAKAAQRLRRQRLHAVILEGLAPEAICERLGLTDQHHIRKVARELGVRLPPNNEWYGKVPA